MEGLSIMIKLTFKHLLVVSVILTLFLGLSLVSATDVTDDNAVSTKNICTHSITSDNNDNIDVNDINNYIKNTFTSTSANNGSNSDENIIKENDNNGNTVGASNGGTITDLKDKIDTGGSSITLTDDYTYNQDIDSGFTEGITVSRDLTIDGQGHTIDLGGKIRFITVKDGYNLVLKNLIIKNGYHMDRGGAVWINGNGSFVNCNFTGNNASQYGGAVNIFQGNGIFINSTFTGNNASQYGGAVNIFQGNGIFINSTFNNNTGHNGGGAVDISYSNGIFINSTFIGNNAKDGGAVCIYSDSGSSGIFINSTFIGNNATKKGGAICIDYSSSGSFVNSTFIDNYVGQYPDGYGGAVYVNSGSGSFINSTFTGNNALSTGGAVYINSTGNGSFINSTFTGNNAASSGGAVGIFNTSCVVSFVNSTFINNTSGNNGGAVFSSYGNGSFINSTFTGNYAEGNGGAIYIYDKNGTAILCRFNTENDTITNVDIIPAIINVLNYTSPYQSGEKLEFNLTADDILFDWFFNTTIDIFKDGELVKTVYGLSGEGWIVDLNPGEYDAVLSLTDYPDEPSSSATLNVEKLASSITADAVSTIYTVDKFLVISLKDSNGNPISGADLSVKLGGIKNYTTNEDGQVLINVAKLYPKTYNAMISYEGSDNFNGSTGSAKVTVNKITSSIIAKSPTFKLNQNIKKYTITLKYLSGKLLANKKVTLNFNGKTYTVKTNNKGQGVFKIYKHLKKGVYNAVITVPENSYYNKVIKKVKITVK